MQTKLLAKETVATGTERFYFEKPTGFEYRAGQSIDLTLVNPPETDAEGNTRAFSLVGAPYEERLSIATRMRDTAFKRVLGAMPIGTELSFEGPFGDFTLHENTKRPAVFLAGGIGITPFHSIIVDALHREVAHELMLFYSNRRPEDAAFLDEFVALAKEHPSFTFAPTMTDMEHSERPWTGAQGYIDAEFMHPYLDPMKTPLFYLAGPPAMVAAMRKMLNETGVSNDDIRTEEFSGY